VPTRIALSAVLALGALALGVPGSGASDPYYAHGNPAPLPVSVPTGCVARGRLYTEGLHLRRKLVALTFDDGPSGFTHHILDVLERKHVHATFFLIGNQVADHPAQVRRELIDGDLLGNHTYTHADPLQIGLKSFLDELQGTQRAIWQNTGFTPCFWRAPYGSIDNRIAYIARGLGLVSIQWDTDPQDFNMPPVATIVHRVLFGNPKDPDPGVHPGAIVLMHDGGGDRSHTVRALPRIIDALRARGYQFVTIAQLLGLPLIYGRPAAALGGPRQEGVGTGVNQ
jgi:peptidoglycan-N-acetylglucosamine deacetylase